jgi:hypothetical protein
MRFWHREPKPEFTLTGTIGLLRLSIFARLMKRYEPRYGKQESAFLSAAILNSAVLEHPGTSEAEAYCQEHGSLIADEVEELHSDFVMAKMLSYLYTAQILFLGATEGPFAEEALALSTRASELGILVRSTHDICGSADVRQCIAEISKYARSTLADS